MVPSAQQPCKAQGILCNLQTSQTKQRAFSSPGFHISPCSRHHGNRCKGGPSLPTCAGETRWKQLDCKAGCDSAGPGLGHIALTGGCFHVEAGTLRVRWRAKGQGQWTRLSRVDARQGGGQSVEYQLRISNSDACMLSRPIQRAHTGPLLSVMFWQPRSTMPDSSLYMASRSAALPWGWGWGRVQM